MNDKAIIFQRKSVGTADEREAELVRLQHYAKTRTLTVMSNYVASGPPNMLTIGLLIDVTLAWSQAGHIIVSDLDLLGKGEGLEGAITSLASAGAVVHVVPGEAA